MITGAFLRELAIDLVVTVLVMLAAGGDTRSCSVEEMTPPSTPCNSADGRRRRDQRSASVRERDVRPTGGLARPLTVIRLSVRWDAGTRLAVPLLCRLGRRSTCLADAAIRHSLGPSESYGVRNFAFGPGADHGRSAQPT